MRNPVAIKIRFTNINVTTRKLQREIYRAYPEELNPRFPATITASVTVLTLFLVYKAIYPHFRSLNPPIREKKER